MRVTECGPDSTRAETLIKRSELSERSDPLPGESPAADGKRVLRISPVLLMAPTLKFFADEPTGNLDAKTPARSRVAAPLQPTRKRRFLGIPRTRHLVDRCRRGDGTPIRNDRRADCVDVPNVCLMSSLQPENCKKSNDLDLACSHGRAWFYRRLHTILARVLGPVQRAPRTRWPQDPNDYDWLCTRKKDKHYINGSIAERNLTVI